MHGKCKQLKLTGIQSKSKPVFHKGLMVNIQTGKNIPSVFEALADAQRHFNDELGNQTQHPEEKERSEKADESGQEWNEDDKEVQTLAYMKEDKSKSEKEKTVTQ